MRNQPGPDQSWGHAKWVIQAAWAQSTGLTGCSPLNHSGKLLSQTIFLAVLSQITLLSFPYTGQRTVATSFSAHLGLI